MIGVIKEGINANVYSEPNADAIVLCVIPSDTLVEVDFRQDLGKFCVVYTSMGIKGFCMKKNIVVK